MLIRQTSFVRLLGKREEAEVNFKIAFKLATEIQQKADQEWALGALGKFYEKGESLDSWKLAIEKYEKALLIAEELGYEHHLSIRYSGLARVYTQIGMFYNAYLGTSAPIPLPNNEPP